MPAQSSYLLLNGLRFHYLNWGDGRMESIRGGTPIVLVHGLASNARIWEWVAPRLVEAGFRVVALDQRNHGLTDPADEGFDFATITHDLHTFIEALALERPLLVGHSWGANTVLHYAATRPLSVSGIALVDGGVGQLNLIPDITWEKAEAMLTPPDLDGMPRDVFLERMKTWAQPFYSEALVEIVLANFIIQDDDTMRRRLPISRHMRIARALFEQRPTELFPRLRRPTLLCPAIAPLPHDERTAQFIARKREGAALAEQANALVQTRWFDDTVHDIPLHRPAELAQALADFGVALSS